MPGIEPISMAVNSAVNLAKVGIGIGQSIKANKLEENYVDPHYEIQQPVKDAYALSERNASQGLSDAADIVWQNNMDRGLGNSLDALLRTGGGVNSFSELYDTFADDVSKRAIFEDEVRRANTGQYYNWAGKMNDELDKQWMINVWKPAQDQKALIANLRQSSTANIFGGVEGVGAAANWAMMAGLYNNDAQFKPGGNSPERPAMTAPLPPSSITAKDNNVGVADKYLNTMLPLLVPVKK